MKLRKGLKMKKDKYILKISLFILFAMTFISCSKKDNTKKENSKKLITFTTVLKEETEIYLTLNECTDFYDETNKKVLPSQSTISFTTEIDIFYNQFIHVITQDKTEGWINITDLTIEKEFFETFLNTYHNKILSSEETSFLSMMLYSFSADITPDQQNGLQDYVSHLIEVYAQFNPNKKLSNNDDYMFFEIISYLWRYIEPNAKTNPFVYLIKYADGSIYPLNNQIYLVLPEIDTSYNYYSILNFPSGREKITPAMQAVLCENLEALDYILSQDFDKDYTSAERKTLVDYIKESNNESIKHLYNNPPQISYYTDLINERAIKDIEDLPPEIYFSLPVSVYYRSLLLPEKIEANNYNDFISELEIQEEIMNLDYDESNYYQQENIFPFEAFVTTDDNSDLIIRKAPDQKASELTRIPQYSKITILEISEDYDQIADIVDYWYKVSINDKVGWCFGGFLSKKMMINDKHIFEENEIYPQKELQNTVYALYNTKIYFLDHTDKEINIGESVEIIATADEQYKKYSDSIYRYYLAKYNNQYGIICGECFASQILYDDELRTYYVSYSLSSSYTCIPFIYKLEKSSYTVTKLEFYTQDLTFSFLNQKQLYASINDDDQYSSPITIEWIEDITIDSSYYELILFNLKFNDYHTTNIYSLYTLENETKYAVENFSLDMG